MQNVNCISHPLLAHSLGILRDQTTGTAEFRRHAAVVSKILLLEASRLLATSSVTVKTPLEETKVEKLRAEVMVVPVLRAGLAMLAAVQDFMPSVVVGFIGLERDEKTAQAHEYYQKIPKILATHKVWVLDPMLATGGSLVDTVAAVKEKGARDITLLCVVAAPEGIDRVTAAHPEAMIITAAIDRELNERKFILPGLGDFGDRYFGTV